MEKSLNVFVLGANRGIGLQLVKDILETYNVNKLFATYRNEDMSKELLDLAGRCSKLETIQLDSRDESKYDEVFKIVESHVQGQGLNLLINNAGVFEKPQDLQSTTKELLLRTFEINAISPFLVTKTLLPLLEAAATANPSAEGINRAVIVNMSSIMGSIDDNGSGEFYAHRASKAALNMMNKSLSVDLKEKNIIAVVLHPGWVATDAGGPNAPINTQQSVAGLLKVISSLKMEDSGKFYDYNGKQLPW